jgi:uncharacterized protein YdaU (DUF1376 family)
VKNKPKPTWFKLYPAEFLADRNVERLNIDEFGLYCYLLMRGWLDGGIPSDLDEIARYAMLRGIPRTKLERMWESVSLCWIPSSDPKILVNPRQEREREAVGDYWEAKSRAGKASAVKRQQRNVNGCTTCVEQVPNTQTLDNRPAQQTDVVSGVTTKLKAAFDGLAARYPNCTDVDFAFQVWMGYCETGVVTEANVHEVDEGLTRYLDSDLWSRDGGRYIISFAKWLHGKKWRDRPQPSAEAKAAAKNGKRSPEGNDPNAEWVPSWRQEVA